MSVVKYINLWLVYLGTDSMPSSQFHWVINCIVQFHSRTNLRQNKILRFYTYPLINSNMLTFRYPSPVVLVFGDWIWFFKSLNVSGCECHTKFLPGTPLSHENTNRFGFKCSNPYAKMLRRERLYLGELIFDCIFRNFII